MAAWHFTFLAAQGYEVGKSLLEEDQIETVRRYLNAAASGGKQILLPSDIVVAPEVARGRAGVPLCRPTGCRQTSSASTSGPDSARVFGRVIAKAKTVFWNGPDGRRRMGELRRRAPRAVAQAPDRGRWTVGRRRRRLGRSGS